MPKRTIHNTLDRIRRRLGWAARGGDAQPRIHDLIYTFICQVMLRGQQDNPDLIMWSTPSRRMLDTRKSPDNLLGTSPQPRS